MLNFSQLDSNLQKTGYTLFAEAIIGALLFGLASQLRISLDFIALVICLINLPAAWLLAKAARIQGRNAWWTGLSSLPPLLAAVNFLILWSTASFCLRERT
jgi:hypothetical protein